MAQGALTGSAGGVKVGATGGVQVTNSTGKCPVCGCGSSGGPCCVTGQDCTIVDNGQGNWASVSTVDFLCHADVQSGPWATGQSGNSPAFTADCRVQATRSAVHPGLVNWCGWQDRHNYLAFRDSTGQSTIDADGLITSYSLDCSAGFYPSGFGQGTASLSTNIDATIGVATIAPLSSTTTALLYGTPQATTQRFRGAFLFTVDGYYLSNSNGNFRQDIGAFSLLFEAYADGSVAIWDGYGNVGVSNSFTITPIMVGACELGTSIGFTVARRAFPTRPLTTYTGSFTIQWASGIGKCKDAMPTTDAACNTITVDGYNAPTPSGDAVPFVDPTDNPIDGGGRLLP